MATLLVVVALYVAFLYFSYIDETHRSGEHYGFEIGMTMDSAFDAARHNQYADELYILHPLYSAAFGPHHELRFTPDELRVLSARERWDLYLDGEGYFNTIRLSFKDGKIYEIHRHRKYFELP